MKYINVNVKKNTWWMYLCRLTVQLAISNNNDAVVENVSLKIPNYCILYVYNKHLYAVTSNDGI